MSWTDQDVLKPYQWRFGIVWQLHADITEISETIHFVRKSMVEKVQLVDGTILQVPCDSCRQQ